MSITLVMIVIATILWFLGAVRFPKATSVDLGWL